MTWHDKWEPGTGNIQPESGDIGLLSKPADRDEKTALLQSDSYVTIYEF